MGCWVAWWRSHVLGVADDKPQFGTFPHLIHPRTQAADFLQADELRELVAAKLASRIGGWSYSEQEAIFAEGEPCGRRGGCERNVALKCHRSLTTPPVSWSTPRLP